MTQLACVANELQGLMRGPCRPDAHRGEHGGAFAYKTVNTDALGWVIRRVTGKSVAQTLSEMVWSRLGMAQNACFTVDSVGNEFAGGGLNTGLR